MGRVLERIVGSRGRRAAQFGGDVGGIEHLGVPELGRAQLVVELGRGVEGLLSGAGPGRDGRHRSRAQDQHVLLGRIGDPVHDLEVARDCRGGAASASREAT